jgi:predicted Zn-dependent protease
MSNLVVAAGTIDPENLERDLTQGLVVTRLAGAAVDPASGRVVLRVAAGREVRHGRRRRQLASFELVGSVLELLARIDGIGCDPSPDRHLGWCVKDGFPLPTGSRVPTLLVHGLTVR